MGCFPWFIIIGSSDGPLVITKPTQDIELWINLWMLPHEFYLLNLIQKKYLYVIDVQFIITQNGPISKNEYLDNICYSCSINNKNEQNK